jgi:serine/threonine-protein kinase
MSDFLSNFTNDKYKADADQKIAEESVKSDVTEAKAAPLVQANEEIETTSVSQVSEAVADAPVALAVEESAEERIERLIEKGKRERGEIEPKVSEEKSDDLVVKDQTFAQKQKRKKIMIGGSAVLVVLGISWFYYSQTHIKLPDFTGKEVSTAQTWADEHKIKLDVKRVYDFDKKVNTVIKEESKNRTIAKSKTVKLTVSLGADPKTKIDLPDFSKLSVGEARDFIKKNKLENTTVQLDYSETVANDGYIKQEFANKDVTAETFKREDNLTLHYSKGKEPIEKNIDVPDFANKTEEEIKTWSKDKGVKVDIVGEGNATIAADKVISQSVKAGEKVSKADTITVKLSLGKPMAVPDFSQFTFEESGSASKDLPVTPRQVYSDTVPYGGFISQSVAAGTQYFAKDTIPDITATYSLGRVYIKDLAGQTEGELQATFYNDYRSKGADITYQIQYVTHSATKGTVVGQSVLNDFVPLSYRIIVQISDGRGK